MRIFLSFSFFCLVLGSVRAQGDSLKKVPSSSDSLAYYLSLGPPKPSVSGINGERLCGVILGESILGIGSMIALSSVWYDGFERVPFHTFDDAGEWLQMDKVGHVVTSYYISRIGIGALKWSGLDSKRSAIYGGLLGLVYETELELLDANSSGWGFSWTDMAANMGGSAFAVAQELLWKEQRISLKGSYHPTSFAAYRPELLGRSDIERVFKDYNGQTYWLSVNIGSFLEPENKFPKWLDASFGYGATGMLGGHTNPELNSAGEILPIYDRQRHFYFSLDADLWKIRKLPKFLKGFTQTFGFIKIPFPAIGFSKEGIAFYPLYF